MIPCRLILIACILMSGFFRVMVPPIMAQETAQSTDTEVFEFTDFEVIDPPSESWTLTKILGRMHPATVHMPIAWLILLAITDIGGLVLRKDWLLKPGYWLALLTAAGFVPALITGLLNLAAHETPSELALTHRNMAFIAFALTLAAVSWRVTKRNRLDGGAKWIYLGFVLAATAVVGLTGHLGGALVFGEDYLPF